MNTETTEAAKAVTLGLIAGQGVLPFFGVSISTLGMAATGSLLAFAYAAPVNSVPKLFGYAIGGTFVGIWSAQLLPHWLNWSWYFDVGRAVLDPPFAGVVALSSRWTLPLVFESLPAIFSRVTGIHVNKDGDTR